MKFNLNLKIIESKFGKYSEIIKHIKNYFGSALFTKCLAFLSIPIFTRLLGPNGYGAIGIFMAVIGIVSIFSSMGVDSSIKRYKFEENCQEAEFIGSNLIFVTIFNIFLISTSIIYADFFSEIFKIDSTILISGVLVGILYGYRSIIFGVWQSRKESSCISKISVINGLATILISLYCVFLMNSYLGQVYGYIISTILITIILFFMIHKELVFRFKNKYIIYSLGIGIPLVFNQLAGYVLSFIDRIILNKYFSLYEVGVYAFAYNIAMIMEVVIYSINSAWVPIMFEKMKKNEMHHINGYLIFFIRVIYLAAFVLIIFSKEMTSLLADGRYTKALEIIPIVVLGYLFRFFYTFYSNVEYFYKKTKPLAFFSVLAGIINLILNIVFIPKFGLMGAAYTTLISYGLLFVFHYMYVKIKLKFEFINIKLLIIPTLHVVGCYLIYIITCRYITSEILVLISKIMITIFLSFIFLKFILIERQNVGVDPK